MLYCLSDMEKMKVRTQKNKHNNHQKYNKIIRLKLYFSDSNNAILKNKGFPNLTFVMAFYRST